MGIKLAKRIFILYLCTRELTTHHKEMRIINNIKTQSKLIYLFVLLCNISFLACTDLDEIESRLNELEETQKKELSQPALTAIVFRAADNPNQLIEDVECGNISDSIVECRINHIVTDKMLVPHLEFNGDSILADGQRVKSDTTRLDFRKPVVMTVANDTLKKSYTVCVSSFTGLPVVWIETKDRQAILSKDNYLRASFRLAENVMTRGGGDVFMDSVNIKGRGNTTWGMPKKPYALKFDNKVSLLGEPKDKSWVLLANYADKTSLRVQTAFYMGSISSLDYTPRYHFVELMLNGMYMGTYQLGEKLKISKDRVNVGDDGFLLEIDAKAAEDEITFMTEHLEQPVNIKDPDVIVEDENYNYIKSYLVEAENALYADNFTDETEGWQKYLDMDSFVDWYLINEISRNCDAAFVSSCYMNLKRGGKLKMGPLWDFDIAFGNIDYSESHDPRGYLIRHASWYSRLFQDPAFVAKVKERFSYFYSHKDDIMQNINENAQYLRYSVEENNNKWGTFYNYTWPNYDVWGSYLNEVQYMKNWLNERFEWLKKEFDV